jgi:hypothetical protein
LQVILRRQACEKINLNLIINKDSRRFKYACSLPTEGKKEELDQQREGQGWSILPANAR